MRPSPTTFARRPCKLGKRAARHDHRTLPLARYLDTSKLPPTPSSVDYTQRVATWPMMKNDTVGDCTCAAAGHMIQQWTTYAGNPFTPSDTQVLDAYAAITGYDPATGDNDNGAAMIDVLNFWRQMGIAGHTIRAFVSLEPKNLTQVEDAVYLFGNLYVGLALPLTAQDQQVWTVPDGGATGDGAVGSWGGHAVPVVAYDRHFLTVVTWGALKTMTWTFFDTYCDESYAVLSQDFLDKADTASNGFDLPALKSDLAALGALMPHPAPGF